MSEPAAAMPPAASHRPAPTSAPGTPSCPADRYGLPGKGRLAEGADADIAIVDPDRTWTVHAADSESTQEYTPFEGFELSAAVTDTFVRGNRVLTDGVVTGTPAGRYLARPY
ncbi:amidohydrolase family protein [Rhodococcus gordoniae]|uniref:amidohydrolase family protein n=1 Tax=Rhodococcus gordoniae TaxID=223392 RepID=UPI001FD85C86|nr:amidohydrolase family protein [Rhodococcus gordoniae]